MRPMRFLSNNTVGVAPGTTTLSLGACPPEAMPWMAYDRMVGISTGPIMPGSQPVNAAQPVGCPYSSPYADMSSMNGLGAAQLQARIRWDIIGLIGGGALVVSLLTGLIASAMSPAKAAR